MLLRIPTHDSTWILKIWLKILKIYHEKIVYIFPIKKGKSLDPLILSMGDRWGWLRKDWALFLFWLFSLSGILKIIIWLLSHDNGFEVHPAFNLFNMKPGFFSLICPRISLIGSKMDFHPESDWAGSKLLTNKLSKWK